ncbi:MAG: hypothetical protein QGH42_07355 [Kiritimatiellia bacterium]|jgi:hypothetical protein|nr:hypothetical protein [Pseudomonadales bacterium]MDP7024041.1 hypothetical protein [Kiritimatiellia bacterium]|tara:strand:- start:628 stop:813 length:186 start_codon:yes stop_codon:yes gene_type:complete
MVKKSFAWVGVCIHSVPVFQAVELFFDELLSGLCKLLPLLHSRFEVKAQTVTLDGEGAAIG